MSLGLLKVPLALTLERPRTERSHHLLGKVQHLFLSTASTAVAGEVAVAATTTVGGVAGSSTSADTGRSLVAPVKILCPEACEYSRAVRLGPGFTRSMHHMQIKRVGITKGRQGEGSTTCTFVG